MTDRYTAKCQTHARSSGILEVVGIAALLVLFAAVGCSSESGENDTAEGMRSPDTAASADADGGDGRKSDMGVCVDRDDDGYGSNAERAQCPACESGEPGGCSRDCDDDNPSVFPSATERCNGTDDNCNELVDEAIGNSSCIENGACPLASSEPPQSGTAWGCAVVDGTMQCILEGANAAEDSSCEEPEAYGVCKQGSWTEVPDRCTSS